MSNCSNCYNGCSEIVSDQCVKYTGVNVPVLGIQTGDSLSYVEQALIEFLTSTLNGTGIKPDIDPAIICALVQQYLPDCGDITAVDLFNALIKAACDLQEQIDIIVADIAVIESPYTVGCLTGVISTSGTHAILQAVITKLCSIDVALTALTLDVNTNYVKLADLCTLVDACITPIPTTPEQYKKMVPYTVVEYYGTLANFDAAGIGITGLGWEHIYLCNGANGTPDKRGRTPVGVTTVTGGGAFNPNVDPAFPGNINYILNQIYGTNTITLTTNQIPAHTHGATSTNVVTDPGHTHLIGQSGVSGGGGTIAVANTSPKNIQSVTNTTGITVATTTVIGSTGTGLSHSNIQPVLACNYIMYIP